MTTHNDDPRISLTKLAIRELRFSAAAYTLDLEKPVSRGGSCLVYHAWKQDPHGPAKRVLLKEFYPRMEGCARWRQREGTLIFPEGNGQLLQRKKRFQESYRLLRRLYNEDTTNLYTVPSGALLEGYGTVYIEEDYGSAVNLEQHMIRQDLSLHDFLCLMKELALIVQRVHKLGYFQLDLKPENILWVDNRLIRLVDTDTFLYKPALEAGHWENFTLSVSRGFSPPEIHWYAESLTVSRTRRKIVKYGHRGDIYSFGCILFSYLFGPEQNHSLLLQEEAMETCLRGKMPHIPGKAIRMIRELLERTTARLVVEREDSMENVLLRLEELLPLTAPRQVRLADNFHRNPYPVIGLKGKLAELRQKLEQQENSTRIVFVSGPGGVGKSTLARQYAQAASQYDIIAEISADSVEQLLIRLRILNWEPDQTLPQRKQMMERLQKLAELSDKFRSLIIVHDFDTPGDSDFGLLYGLNCDVILTGRYHWHLAGVPTVSLACGDYAPEDQKNAAREIFLQYYLQDNQSEELLQFLNADEESVVRLTEQLSFHPLSLKLMARQMTARSGEVMLPREALNRLLRDGISLNGKTAYQNDTTQSILWSNTHGHLLHIFQGSFACGRFTRQQLEALRYMLVVSPSFGISPGRFREWSGMPTEHLEDLCSRGWLEWNPYRQDPLDEEDQPGIYTIPLAIREVLQESAALRLTTANCGSFLDKLSQTMYTYRSRSAFLSFCEQQKNLIYLLRREKTLAYARLLKCAEHGLHQLDGSKTAGETLLEYGKRRLEIYRLHPDTAAQQANCCLQLSRYAFEMGDKTSAFSYQEQYLLLEQQYALPPNADAFAARTQANELLWSCGRWKEALGLTKKLSDAASAHLGEGHILSLNARYNLGGYLLQYGEVSEAQDVLWEVVQICQDPEKTGGSVEAEQFRARSLFTLGQLYLEVDYGESAVTCLQQAYKIFSRWWGKEHLFCAEILCHLADALRITDNLSAALSCRADAYAVYCKHPEGQLFPAANCLFQLVMDCMEVSDRQELANQLWQENLKLYNQVQSFLLVETWQDALELIRQVSSDAIEQDAISKGLQLRELQVRLLARIMGPSEELRREYINLASQLRSLGLPVRADQYLQRAEALAL